MAIDVTKKLGLAGATVADEFLKQWDEREGRTEPFRTASDIYRLGLLLGGLAVEAFWPRYGRWGTIASDAGAVLVTQALAKPIRQWIGASQTRQFAQRRRAPSPASMPTGGSVVMPTPVEEIIGSVT